MKINKYKPYHIVISFFFILNVGSIKLKKFKNMYLIYTKTHANVTAENSEWH